jgi:hypothetical protein
MLTNFQVGIYHTPGPYKQNNYAGEAYVHSSFWILMKALEGGCLQRPGSRQRLPF